MRRRTEDIGVRKALVKYLIRDIILYNDKIIINYYFADPLKKHNNSIESIKETEKQSKEAAPLSDFQSSYKGDNSPPNKMDKQTRLSVFFTSLNNRDLNESVKKTTRCVVFSG